jgi:hypothetical protein
VGLKPSTYSCVRSAAGQQQWPGGLLRGLRRGDQARREGAPDVLRLQARELLQRGVPEAALG